ncbi:hypothetical protein [Arthrobacter sp. Y81]|uniref:hypothetical protein n=1 Tax=Arthrobacter sp. Y81 TaxID=2058897 RepID=UPI0011B02486|nr:hypothetical protein [Arthrobacter sp. Y81]
MDDNELLATVADLARRAGADEPDRLARTFTLLLGGALSISSRGSAPRSVIDRNPVTFAHR